MNRFIALITLLAMVASIPPAVRADEHLSDSDLAREAVERGEIMPLAKAVETLISQYPGEIVEVEFEREDGLPVYDLELVTEDGRLLDVEIDAATGAIIEVEEDD